MAVTYEPIASQTLGSDAASITFGSGGTLPQTYTDLVIVAFSAEGAVNPNLPTLAMTFNGDTGNNYSRTLVFGNGSTASSARGSSNPAWYHASGTTSDYRAAVISIMSYSNTNVFKTGLAADGNAGASVVRNVGLWRSTSAITSITIAGLTANLKSGSTFSLYGIKAA